MKLVLGLVVAGSGCAGVDHVSIAPLPPDPTPPQRMWTYETYRPQGDVTEVIRSCDRYGCSTTKNKVLMFPNGTVVRDPADLEPLVAPDSHVMDSARAAHRADERARWWGYGLIASIAVGMAFAMDGNSRENSSEMDVGLGIAVGGLLVGGIGGYGARAEAREARKTAFAWYPHDLAEKLHVCWNGAQVVPCEAITPGAPPAQPVDPNLEQLRPR